MFSIANASEEHCKNLSKVTKQFLKFYEICHELLVHNFKILAIDYTFYDVTLTDQYASSEEIKLVDNKIHPIRELEEEDIWADVPSTPVKKVVPVIPKAPRIGFANAP
jgi:hypothetical protein